LRWSWRIEIFLPLGHPSGGQGVGLLLFSEAVFWAEGAVGHLKSLAEAEYDGDESEAEEKAE
jgi:hypothetical protein